MPELTQPTEIPGPYRIAPQPFPKAARIIRAPYPGFGVYGVFSYDHNRRRWSESMREVGWSYTRIGGTPTPADIEEMTADGLAFSPHACWSPNRDAFGTDEAFLQAAENSARRRIPLFGLHAAAVHVWNEVNYKYLLAGNANNVEVQLRRAKLYGKLLMRISSVVREHYPELPILGFDTGGAGQNATDFVRYVYEMYPDIGDHYDIFAHHPGVSPAPPDANYVRPWSPEGYSVASSIADLREIVNKPVWITEGHWPIPFENGGKYEMPASQTVSPELQAAYWCRYYATALRIGVQRVAPFFVEDTDTNNGGCFDSATGKWRLCAKAVRIMIREMPRPKLVEVIRDGYDGVYAWRFARDATDETAGSVVMAWNVDGPRRVVGIDLGATHSSPATVVDMLGGVESVPAPVVGGTVYTLELGPCPVYVS